MKNRLTDLNNHLYVALERVNADGQSDENLGKSIEQARSVQGLSHSVLSLGRLVLDAATAHHAGDIITVPELLSVDAPKALAKK